MSERLPLQALHRQTSIGHAIKSYEPQAMTLMCIGVFYSIMVALSCQLVTAVKQHLTKLRKCFEN